MIVRQSSFSQEAAVRASLHKARNGEDLGAKRMAFGTVPLSFPAYNPSPAQQIADANYNRRWNLHYDVQHDPWAQANGTAAVENAQWNGDSGFFAAVGIAGPNIAAGLASLSNGGPATIESSDVEDGLTFRGDSRPPDEIFPDGFSARGYSTNILYHANDSSDPPSAFIPTSTSCSVPIDMGYTNIYVINTQQYGINVNTFLDV